MKKTMVQVNGIKKEMNIAVDGRITKEDSVVFLAQYRSATKTINASEFTLKVDCTNMQLLTKDMYDDLGQVMNLYKTSGFKLVEFTIKSNQILKMQLNRIAKGQGLTNISFVDVA